MTKLIKIWTDGACSGNPGPGGWAALLLDGSNRIQLSGNAKQTTNNRMELMAVIKAIQAVDINSHLLVYSDSKYVISGVTQWLESWKKKNWLKADNKPVANIELWKTLDSLISNRQIQWQWTKGHSQDPNNIFCDQLARNKIDELCQR